MATTGESKSENEEFLGFDEEAQVAVFQPREEEYLPGVLESDISVSFVPTEVIGLIQERRRKQWWSVERQQPSSRNLTVHHCHLSDLGSCRGWNCDWLFLLNVFRGLDWTYRQWN